MAVLTAPDMKAAKVTSVARHVAIANLVMPLRPPLADGRVLHVGQPVAAVIAKTARQARDAAELIAVDYDVLPSVVDLRAAEKPGAPQLWPEAPGNVAVDWPGPAPDPAANAAEVERIFAGAAHVARVSVVNQRVIVAAIETRGATASYDAAADLYTLRVCSQGAGALRDTMASIMGLTEGTAARHHRGRGRRLRHEVLGLSGISGAAGGGAQARAGRCTGCRTARKPSSATTRRATRSPTASWRWTRKAASSRCASGILPMSEAFSPTPARIWRRRISPNAFRPCTASRISTSGCAASSPIPCRSGRIAAPGGRKPITCWSAWWTKPRASSASTARSCAGAISFRARPCPTRRRWAQNTTAAISPPCSTRRWSRATMPASKNAGAKAQDAAACAASASPASSNIPAAARPKAR